MENNNQNTKAVDVVVFTIGCKVNQYDSDGIVYQLINKGLNVAENLVSAKVYIINTCAVTGEAERKSRQAIQRARSLNSGCQILVCGCASQKDGGQFAEKENVVFVSGTANKQKLADIVVNLLDKTANNEDQTAVSFNNAASNDILQNESTTTSEVLQNDVYKSNTILPTVYENEQGALSLRTRHYIKVQDGCNNFCSYCIVPYLRGRSRSKSMDSVLKEIEEVTTSKEIVLTGINLSAYGKDINLSLTSLINEISKTNTTLRVRLGSLEVGIIDDEFLTALKGLKNFCPQFHLSLQSGSDIVLKDMNRRYTSSEYLEKIGLIRTYFADAGVTTDIIVGYPTETEAEFKTSKEFVKTVGFADIHIFSYSKRSGTNAAKLTELSPEILKVRATEMAELKEQLKDSYNQKFIGKPLEVLFETKDGDMVVGHSENYITVYKKLENSETLKTYKNQIVTVVPKGKFKDGLL